MRIFVIMYSIGSYEDFREKLIFATKDKKVAEDYTQKAESILRKWIPILIEKANEESESGYKSYVFTPRYDQLSEINRFYIKEIELK